MTYKPRWVCANCGMHSSRTRQGVFVSYIDYLAGRRDGYYFPNAPPNFINEPKPELVLSPPKMYDVFQEEVWREMARQAIRKRR